MVSSKNAVLSKAALEPFIGAYVVSLNVIGGILVRPSADDEEDFVIDSRPVVQKIRVSRLDLTYHFFHDGIGPLSVLQERSFEDFGWNQIKPVQL